MADDYTVLNPGAGGEVMDEEAVTYSVAPTTRFRTRVVLGGGEAAELVKVTDEQPADNSYALVIRPVAALQDRMLEKRVYDSTYRLWIDTGDAAYIYTAEALTGSNPAVDMAWRGVRIPLDASGNIVGGVAVSTGFAWDNRAAATWDV